MSIDSASVGIEYPESDGKPMGETDLHRNWIVQIIQLLEHRFRDEETYVSGDLLVYYEEGNPRQFIVPDAFIVKNGGTHLRRIYKLWEEGRPPNVAFEVTSRSTQQKDIDKFKIYQRIGVNELVLFDPTADYLTPSLQGFLLGDDDYDPISRDKAGRIRSTELDADLFLEDGDLVIYDCQTGERWMTAKEAAVAQRDAAQAQHDHERARADELESELIRLREQLRRQRGESPRQ